VVVRRMAVRIRRPFSAAEYAKAGGEVLFVIACEASGYGGYPLTGQAFSAGGSGGRTREPRRSGLPHENPSDGGAFYDADIWPDNAQPAGRERRVEPAIATRLAS